MYINFRVVEDQTEVLETFKDEPSEQKSVVDGYKGDNLEEAVSPYVLSE